MTGARTPRGLAAAFVAAAALIAVALHPAGARAQTVRDSANTAWTSGNTAEALALYNRIAAADSSNGIALHRIALINAWAERYTESIRVFDRLISIQPNNREARLDRARVFAWSGNTSASAAIIDSLLAQDPRNVDALQARAQFLSWSGNYDDALRSYDRILEIAPDNRTTRMDRARVLSWAEKFSTASAVYDSLLMRDPADRDALLGLGNVLTLTSKFDSARVVYSKLITKDARDVDALRGMARAATWQGSLTEGESRWRAAVDVAPANVDVLVGLAQVLRWQGRDAAALEVLTRARAIAPSNADVREQMMWIATATAPRASPSVTFEDDSDGNKIFTTAIGAAFRPGRRLELRADAYRRTATDATSSGDPGADPTAYGATLGAWLQLEPGWALTLSAGGSRSADATAKTISAMRASISTPGRHVSGATVSWATAALDGTAALIAREVHSTELAMDVHTTISRFNLAAAASGAQFEARSSGTTNNRWSTLGVVTRNMSHGITLGVRARAFGFEKDVNDAYFDPDFYGLIETTSKFLREKKRLSLSVEVAPGIQKVRSTGDPSGSLRLGSRIGYTFRPGRVIAINGAYSKSGLQQLSPTVGADYRYTAIGLSAGWTF